MKRYVEIEAEACRCKYCGNIVVTIDDYGQCSHGCPGNMKIIEGTKDTIYLDLVTGQTLYSVSVKKREEEIIPYSELEAYYKKLT